MCSIVDDFHESYEQLPTRCVFRPRAKNNDQMRNTSQAKPSQAKCPSPLIITLRKIVVPLAVITGCYQSRLRSHDTIVLTISDTSDSHELSTTFSSYFTANFDTLTLWSFYINYAVKKRPTRSKYEE